MNQCLTAANRRLALKEPAGWFAAGGSFRKALSLLSDGSFRLFAYICLEADRHTGRFHATHKELAVALGKSKRAVGTYVGELQAKRVCQVKAGKNQFEPTQFEIADEYWPYHRTEASIDVPENYVSSVRDAFLALGCVESSFGAADEAIARDLQRRAIPLAVVEQAMLLAACRKYGSWIEAGQRTEPIRSLAYFKAVIAEIQETPVPPGYDGYLRRKVRQLTAIWAESAGPQIPTCDPMLAQKSNQQCKTAEKRRDDTDYRP